MRRSVLGHSAWLLASLVGTYGVFVAQSVLGNQRRVLKEKTSSRLIAPSDFAGRIPLAKYRGRHYCIGTNLSTKMADSVENRVVPAVPIPSTLYFAEEMPTHDEVERTKPCVNMLSLPLQSCTVEHMAKAKVLSERIECIPIKKITPVIDEEPL